MTTIERAGIGTAALMVALTMGIAAQEAEVSQAPVEEHVAEAAHAPAATVHVPAGEPVLLAMGCLMEGHGDHHGLVLSQVQRGSISLSGVTTGEAGEWRRVPAEEVRTAHPMTNSYGMLFNAEYALEAGIPDLTPFLGQQVRLTAALRASGESAVLQPLQVSPIGAVCAGAH